MTACIVGWAHTPFGRLEGETVESLIVRVAQEALADAGVEARDIDEIVLGHFNAGFSAQDFTASLVLQASPDLRFKRASRVENACATGSAAVHQGLRAIAAKSARMVLVVGVEQMTTTPAAEIGRNLLKAPGINNWDISFFKRFSISERHTIEFRAEMFNAFNHPQFVIDDPFATDFVDVTSPNFQNEKLFSGSPTGPVTVSGTNPLTGGNPRVIQMVLRYRF